MLRREVGWAFKVLWGWLLIRRNIRPDIWGSSLHRFRRYEASIVRMRSSRISATPKVSRKFYSKPPNPHLESSKISWPHHHHHHQKRSGYTLEVCTQVQREPKEDHTTSMTVWRSPVVLWSCASATSAALVAFWTIFPDPSHVPMQRWVNRDSSQAASPSRTLIITESELRARTTSPCYELEVWAWASPRQV